MSDPKISKLNRKRLMSRRDVLFEAGGGMTGVALALLLNQDGLLAAPPPAGGQACVGDAKDSPYLPKQAHFKPKAKSVISLFMSGGMSQVDTFDYKPMLEKYHRQPLTGQGEIVVRQGYPGPLMKSPWTFKQYGQCGKWVSEIFP